MARNLAARKDIPADALRQRRDMYALAIGLSLFCLAGGTIGEATSWGGVLPIKLSRPEALLWAAWTGFFYFWFRFWLISDARPFADFFEDVQWQAGSTSQMRELAAQFLFEEHIYGDTDIRAELLSPAGIVPMPSFDGLKPVLSLDSIWPRSPRHGGVGGRTVGPKRAELERKDRLRFARAIAQGTVRAMFRERTFTDYTVPHLFAIATVALGLYRLANPPQPAPTKPVITVPVGVHMPRTAKPQSDAPASRQADATVSPHPTGAARP